MWLIDGYLISNTTQWLYETVTFIRSCNNVTQRQGFIRFWRCAADNLERWIFPHILSMRSNYERWTFSRRQSHPIICSPKGFAEFCWCISISLISIHRVWTHVGFLHLLTNLQVKIGKTVQEIVERLNITWMHFWSPVRYQRKILSNIKNCQ